MKLILLLIFTFTVNSLPTKVIICKSKECQKVSNILYSHLDETVDPCDDWFLYACGNFPKVNPLIDGESSIDTLGLLSNANDKRAETILDDENLLNHGSEIIRKVKKLYDQCLNSSQNVLDDLKENLVQKLLRQREILIEQLSKPNSDFYVRPKVPSIKSIVDLVSTMSDRDYCSRTVQYQYDFAFTRIYLDKYVDQKSTKVARQVLNSVHSSLLLKVNISCANSNEKNSYKENLKKLERNLVYPDWIINDDELDSEYEDDETEDLNQLIEKLQTHPWWPMPILMVNAHFSPNEISK